MVQNKQREYKRVEKKSKLGVIQSKWWIECINDSENWMEMKNKS